MKIKVSMFQFNDVNTQTIRTLVNEKEASDGNKKIKANKDMKIFSILCPISLSSLWLSL